MITVAIREHLTVLRTAIETAVQRFGATTVPVAETSDVDVTVWSLGPAASSDEVAALAVHGCVVVLVESPSEEMVDALFALGVRGVLDRNSSPETIAAVALACANGCRVVPPGRRLDLKHGQPSSHVLSREQLRWMRELAHGTSARALARAEGFSERVLYRHLNEVYRRLGVQGRAEALVMLAGADLLGERGDD